MSIYTFQEKLWLYEHMKNQTEDDTLFVYRVLKKNDEEFTENSNGLFFDLDRVSNESIRELMMYYKVVRPLTDPPYYEER
jgi:hypothetical protein